MAASLMRRVMKAAFSAAGYDVYWHRRETQDLTPEAQAERSQRIAEFLESGGASVHYGAGDNPLGDGWLNVDFVDRRQANYICADLTKPHPFPDGTFRFAFAQDFLEHLDQEQSLRFLIEVYRTLRPGGVLRLSFPGLEGVLRGSYAPPVMERALEAAKEAYADWGHKHFYSLEELRTVAYHIGFSQVLKVDHGRSTHHELRGLDGREDQIGVNTYVELVK